MQVIYFRLHINYFIQYFYSSIQHIIVASKAHLSSKSNLTSIVKTIHLGADILLCSWNLLLCTTAHFLTVSRMWPLAGPIYTWEYKIIWHLTCMCNFSTSKNPFQIAEHSDSQCSTVYYDTWKLAKCRIQPYRTFTYTVPYSMRIWQW